MAKLTPKQRKFIIEYFKCGMNATEAAARAGYAGDRATLAVTGFDNLRNPKIREQIEKRMEADAMSASEVVARLSAIARTDMSEFITIKHGITFLNAEKAEAAGVLHLIKKVKIKDEGIEVELYDKQAALVQLGKYHALFTDRVKIDDWRSQAIRDIRDRKIQFEDLAEAFDEDLATQLFREAGVPVSSG